MPNFFFIPNISNLQPSHLVGEHYSTLGRPYSVLWTSWSNKFQKRRIFDNILLKSSMKKMKKMNEEKNWTED